MRYDEEPMAPKRMAQMRLPVDRLPQLRHQLRDTATVLVDWVDSKGRASVRVAKFRESHANIRRAIRETFA